MGILEALNSSNSDTRPSKVACWLLACRPRTLAVSVAPVFLGSALAYTLGSFSLPVALAALFGALAIQTGTNLVNDFCDAKKGADTEERLGPVRVTARGWIPEKQVLSGAIAAFLLAGVLGLYLVMVAGWPVLVIGVVSILAGILYTAGPYSLAYLGLGDLFTLVFFGPVATAGTFFVLTGTVIPQAVLLGFIPGLFSVALIAINNLRDRETDRCSGKKTLAVRFGEQFARFEIAGSLLLAPALPWLIFPPTDSAPKIPLLLLLSGFCLVLPAVLPVLRGTDGRDLNRLIGKIGTALLAYSFLVGIFLPRLFSQ